VLVALFDSYRRTASGRSDETSKKNSSLDAHVVTNQYLISEVFTQEIPLWLVTSTSGAAGYKPT